MDTFDKCLHRLAPRDRNPSVAGSDFFEAIYHKNKRVYMGFHKIIMQIRHTQTLPLIMGLELLFKL